MSLKDIANDLIQLVEEATPPPEPMTEEQLSLLGRTVVHYVMSQIDSDDAADTVGEAMVVGARALAEDSGVPGDVLAQQVVQTLDAMAEAARALL
jgi:hypothetical protein